MATMRVRLAAIRALEDAHGRVTAAAMVEAARARTHKLHDEFEWDNAKGGQKWRLHQARLIIASVRYVEQVGDQQVQSVAYVRCPETPSNRQNYVSVERLRTEAQNAHEALVAEINHIQARLERIKELASVLELSEEFAESLSSALAFTSRMRRGLPSTEGVPLQ